jgi:hypothetical protein
LDLDHQVYFGCWLFLGFAIYNGTAQNVIFTPGSYHFVLGVSSVGSKFVAIIGGSFNWQYYLLFLLGEWAAVSGSTIYLASLLRVERVLHIDVTLIVTVDTLMSLLMFFICIAMDSVSRSHFQQWRYAVKRAGPDEDGERAAGGVSRVGAMLQDQQEAVREGFTTDEYTGVAKPIKEHRAFMCSQFDAVWNSNSMNTQKKREALVRFLLTDCLEGWAFQVSTQISPDLHNY